MRKINIFVDIGVKVRGLMALHSVFSPVIEISKLGKILTFEKNISEKRSSPLFRADRKKANLKILIFKRNTCLQPFFETEMLLLLYSCKSKCYAYVFIFYFDQFLA